MNVAQNRDQQWVVLEVGLSECLGVQEDGTIIVKWILKKLDVRVQDIENRRAVVTR
jgi:hypothetical protein